MAEKGQSLYLEKEEEVVELLPPINHDSLAMDEDVEDGLTLTLEQEEMPLLSYAEEEEERPIETRAKQSAGSVMAEEKGYSKQIRKLTQELRQAKKELEERDEQLEALEAILEENRRVKEEDASKRDEQVDSLKDCFEWKCEEVKKLEGMLEEERKLRAEAEKKLSGGSGDMKKLMEKETQLRVDTEGKLKKLRERVGLVFAKFVQLTGGRQSEFVVDGEEDVEDLVGIVEERFQDHVENQNRLKGELAREKKKVADLERIVISNRAGGDNLVTAMTQVGNGPIAQPSPQGPEEPLPSTSAASVTRDRRRFILKPTQQPPPTPVVHLPSTSSASENRDNSGTPNGNLLHGEDKDGVGLCLCGQQYSTRSNLRIHIRAQTEGGKFSCQTCGQAFVHYYTLRCHLKDKHGISPPKGAPSIGCADCGSLFSTFTELYSHKRNEHSQNGKKSKTPKPVVRPAEPNVQIATLTRDMKFTHQQTNICKKGRGHGCAVCGEFFPSDGALRQHHTFAHDANHPVKLQAPTSGLKRSKTPMRSPRTIVKTAKRRSIPSTSATSPAARKSTDLEKVIHHGVDQSKVHIAAFCICGKQFATDKALRAHVQYSSRERNLPCELCDKKYICPSYLKQHMQSAHKGCGVIVKTRGFTLSKCRK